jgi:hypothetical protein
MDYRKLYDNLISLRQVNKPSGYVERHHIIMRSLGGSDEASNMIPLTGREHWIAHLLLHKIHRRSETVHACHMMAMRCEERGIPFIKNSRMYEKIRKECAKLTSARMKISQGGKGNSQHGTRWICNVDLKENKKISKENDIPFGWIVGRNKWKPKKKKPLKGPSFHQAIQKEKTLHKIQRIKAEYGDQPSHALFKQIAQANDISDRKSVV